MSLCVKRIWSRAGPWQASSACLWCGDRSGGGTVVIISLNLALYQTMEIQDMLSGAPQSIRERDLDSLII